LGCSYAECIFAYTDLFGKGSLENKKRVEKRRREERREEKRRGKERRGGSGKRVGAWVRRPVTYNFVSVFALLRTRSVAFAFRQ